MAENTDFVWCVKLRPNRLTIYQQYWGKKKIRKEDAPWMENLANNETHGNLSDKASGKIKDGIAWLMYMSRPKKMINPASGKEYKFRLSFFTLSLPSEQIHSDQEIKSGPLNQFLVEARKKWGLHNYLWRAEAQVNGNIHFHFVSDVYIPYLELRAVWNRCINTLGYVDRFSKKMHDKFKNGFICESAKPGSTKWNIAKTRFNTGIKSNWSDPNSTDIKSVAKIKNLAGYLAEYCAKKSENRAIEGRLWFLSTSLSKLKGKVVEIYTGLAEDLLKLDKKFSDSLHWFDFCSVYYLPHFCWRQAGAYRLCRHLKEYVLNPG